MSLIEIEIQRGIPFSQNSSEAKSAENYEDNFQLPDDDFFEGRCGEIFISHGKNLVFICSLCDRKYAFFDDFLCHISTSHYKIDIKNEYHKLLKNEEDENEVDWTQSTLKSLDIVKEEEFSDLYKTQSDEETNSGDNKYDATLETQLKNEDDSEDENFIIEHEIEALEEFVDMDSIDTEKICEMELANDRAVDSTAQINDLESSINTSAKITKNLKLLGTRNNCWPSPRLAYKCTSCDASFEIEHYLKLHQKTHESNRKHKCNICGFAFKVLNNLRAHKKRHAGEKPFPCSSCPRRFMTSSEMKSHHRTHTGEKPFVCEECGGCFKTSGALSIHKKRHSNKRDYKCDICNRLFSRVGQLRNHVSTHTGERRYKCKTCGAKFKQVNVLLQHSKLHAANKQYACHLCDKKFSQRPGLTYHLKSHRFG